MGPHRPALSTDSIPRRRTTPSRSTKPNAYLLAAHSISASQGLFSNPRLQGPVSDQFFAPRCNFLVSTTMDRSPAVGHDLPCSRAVTLQSNSSIGKSASHSIVREYHCRDPPVSRGQWVMSHHSAVELWDGDIFLRRNCGTLLGKKRQFLPSAVAKSIYNGA